MNVLDYLLLLVRNRWFLVRNVVFVTLLFIGISFLLPKWYRSSATVIPVAGESNGIASLLGGYSLNVFGKNVVIPESYRVILRSQGLKDSLLTEFDLFEVYKVKRKDQVYKKLNRVIEIEVDKEVGIGYSPIVAINIHVQDKDPTRAMNMANFCMSFLHQKSKDLNAYYVERRHAFVEGRYSQSVEELNVSEEALRTFQNEYGVVEITEQVKLIVQNLAMLEAEKEQMELQLGIMATTMDTSNPAYQQVRTNIQVVQKQIAEFRGGTEFPEGDRSLFFPTDEIPDLVMNYYRLYRDVEVGNKIYEMLTIQFEQSKIQLNKDLPALLILDEAQLPTHKYKPKRIYIALSGFVFSLLLSLVYVLVRNFYFLESQNKSEYSRKMDEILALLKSDFSRSRR